MTMRDENRNKRNRMLAEKIIKGLESRNSVGYYCETKEEALAQALSLMPEGSSVGWGGSMSIEEIGLKQAVIEGNYKEYNRDIVPPAEKRQVMLDMYSANFFITSTNAITEDGILVNLDGNANRVSMIAYGPEKVIMIVGMNKVAKDLDHAIYRVRNEAAPINTKRFPIETPCNKTGACADCKVKGNICCQMLITRFSMHPGRINVILVNEDLGF